MTSPSIATHFVVGIVLVYGVSNALVAEVLGESPALVSWAGEVELEVVPGTIGWAFKPNVPIRVTSVGVFDDGGDGLAESHTIGLWGPGANSLNPIFTGTVPAGGAAPLVSNYRYLSTRDSSGLVLEPGETYVLGAHYSDSAEMIRNTTTSYRMDDAVTWVSGRITGESASFAYPHIALTRPSVFTVNFQFEPASPTVVSVLFSGGPSEFGSTGMHQLQRKLRTRFVQEPDFNVEVFHNSAIEEALAYISSFDDSSCVVIGGHSLGGVRTVELAQMLNSAGRTVDLTVQVDSIGFFDDELPANVLAGVNYYQVLDPDFPGDLQGEMVVRSAGGAVVRNINVEQLFNNPYMTHYTIDGDAGVHRLIESEIAGACNLSIPRNGVSQLISGSPVSLIQQVDIPSTPVNLTFDYAFETLTGDFTVVLNNIVVGTILAPSSITDGFTRLSFLIDGPLLGQSDVDLQFILDGPSGARLLLDNVTLPGLVNGDFELEGLAGWRTMITGNGSVQAITVAVPEPTTAVLTLAVLLTLCVTRRPNILLRHARSPRSASR